MNDDITQLLAFHKRCRPDATGHGLAELESHQAALIERFIAGHCDDEDRRKLAAFLLSHPTWIRWIANRIKTARETSRQSA